VEAAAGLAEVAAGRVAVAVALAAGAFVGGAFVAGALLVAIVLATAFLTGVLVVPLSRSPIGTIRNGGAVDWAKAAAPPIASVPATQ
jgi:hypothetical protein